MSDKKTKANRAETIEVPQSEREACGGEPIPMPSVDNRVPRTDDGPCGNYMPLPANIPVGESWIKVVKAADGTLTFVPVAL